MQALIVGELLSVLRRFCRGEYGIALGGARAKGVEDAASDVDLYVFAKQVLPNGERTRHVNRIKGLLVGQGIHLSVDNTFLTYLPELRLWDGAPLSDLQRTILELLGIPEAVYTQLARPRLADAPL